MPPSSPPHIIKSLSPRLGMFECLQQKKKLAFSVPPEWAKNFGQSAKKTHFCVQSYKRKRANKFCWPATFFYKLKFQILLIYTNFRPLFFLNPKFVKKGGKLTYLGKVGEGGGAVGGHHHHAPPHTGLPLMDLPILVKYTVLPRLSLPPLPPSVCFF